MDDVYRQFRHDVNRKLDLKKMHRAVQSSDYKKIYSVIIDSYHTTRCGCACTFPCTLKQEKQ